jgi:hypothetical protein
MKKLITLFFCMFLVNAAFSGLRYPPGKGDILEKYIVMKPDDVCFYGWADYAGSIKRSESTYVSSYLFPDTNGVFRENGNKVRTWQSAAFIFDPAYFYGNMSFQTDSLSVSYHYKRKKPDRSIKDTLIVYVFQNDDEGSLTLKEFDYNGSNAEVVSVPYDPSGLKPRLPVLKEIKIILDEKDTTQNGVFRNLKSGLDLNIYNTVERTVVMGIAITFKPGYSYDPGEIITETGNYFSLVSMEENGPDTFSNYNFWHGKISSQLIGQADLKSQSDSARYISTFERNREFASEHHLISVWMQVCALSVNSKDLYLEDEVEIYPNPASTVLNFESKYVSHIDLTVISATGRIMEKRMVNIKKKEKIDLSGYDEGVYWLVIKSEEKGMTKQIQIRH